MYYNRILRVWVIDALDYFLLSIIFGSIVASCLKDYLSEKKAMERLKNSIIKKSKLVHQSDRSISNFNKIKLKKIYKFALGNRGGQFEQFQADSELYNEAFKLVQEIKISVERLASFLKERELKGVARIFFKNGRLLLELILYKCKIDITYSLLTQGLSTQVSIITATTGGATGFILSWFSVGASLVIPPIVGSVLLTRSIIQSILNQRDYPKFKKLINKMLEDDELKQTIRAVFLEEEVPTITGIEMKPWDLDKNPLPEFNFDSDQTFEKFLKARTKEEFKEIPHTRRIKNKLKGKTVYFKDFINQIAEDSDDIIDAEIVKEAIKVKVKNEEL